MDQLINTFYKAFAKLDSGRMVACYHDDIIFEDPAFGVLKGTKAKNMWKMLCYSQKNKDFQVVFGNVQANETTGTAEWEAAYTFSKTGRKVHNIIKASFEFKDGKIIKHTDDFNLYKWSKQAMGLQGILIGWTPFFKNKLQQQTNKLLTEFESRGKRP